MRENILLIAALIIIGATVIVIVLVTVMFISEWEQRRLKKIRLDFEKGDRKAEQKLRKQLQRYTKQVEDAEQRRIDAQRKLTRFKMIYELFDIEDKKGKMVVELPADIESLTFRDSEDNFNYFYEEDLRKAQEVSNKIDLLGIKK